MHSTKQIIKITAGTRRFARYSRVYLNHGTKLLASDRGIAFGVGFGIIGTGFGMYCAAKGNNWIIEYFSNFQELSANHQEVVNMYKTLLQKDKEMIQ